MTKYHFLPNSLRNLGLPGKYRTAECEKSKTGTKTTRRAEKNNKIQIYHFVPDVFFINLRSSTPWNHNTNTSNYTPVPTQIFIRPYREHRKTDVHI